MAQNPKITIVTIAYNSASSIATTIESVLADDYVNKEYIIIDGASTDNTLEIVHQFKGIDLVVSEPDKGISDAFNKGILYATGDLIVFINSDDILLPGTLKRVAEEYKEGEADIYCCNVVMQDAASGHKCREVPSTDFPVMPFFRHVAHQGLFATRESYKKFGGYDTNVRWPMDLEFLMRAYRMGARWKYIDHDAAIFKSGGTTNQNSIFKKRKDYLYIVRKNGGSWLQAWTFYSFLVATQLTKKVLNLMGKNLGQRLRYKNAN